VSARCHAAETIPGPTRRANFMLWCSPCCQSDCLQEKASFFNYGSWQTRRRAMGQRGALGSSSGTSGAANVAGAPRMSGVG
jgi:hypothetical protein